MPHREDTVARLMAEALAGQLPRPVVLRRAAALDLCDPLVGILLAAQSRTGCAAPPIRPETASRAAGPSPLAFASSPARTGPA